MGDYPYVLGKLVSDHSIGDRASFTPRMERLIPVLRYKVGCLRDSAERERVLESGWYWGLLGVLANRELVAKRMYRKAYTNPRLCDLCGAPDGW